MRQLLSLLVLITVSSPVMAADNKTVTYGADVAPLMKQRCLACHSDGAPTLAEFYKDKEGWKKKGKGPRMDSYESLMAFVNGADAGAMMRRLDDGKKTKDGKPGNMNVYLGDSDAARASTLALFKRWIGESSWLLKKRPEWTDAEIAAVKAPR